MRCFTPSGSAETSMPPTRAVPDVGASSPHSMRIVVDLPAPLLPRKPKISPRATSNDTSSTATNAPKRRVRWRTSIAGAVDIDLLLPPDGAREARIGEPGARTGARGACARAGDAILERAPLRPLRLCGGHERLGLGRRGEWRLGRHHGLDRARLGRAGQGPGGGPRGPRPVWGPRGRRP